PDDIPYATLVSPPGTHDSGRDQREAFAAEPLRTRPTAPLPGRRSGLLLGDESTSQARILRRRRSAARYLIAGGVIALLLVGGAVAWLVWPPPGQGDLPPSAKPPRPAQQPVLSDLRYVKGIEPFETAAVDPQRGVVLTLQNTGSDTASLKCYSYPQFELRG